MSTFLRGDNYVELYGDHGELVNISWHKGGRVKVEISSDEIESFEFWPDREDVMSFVGVLGSLEE